jgi:hypothetical protein
MNPGLTLIAILHGKPEKRDDLLATQREFVKPTRGRGLRRVPPSRQRRRSEQVLFL